MVGGGGITLAMAPVRRRGVPVWDCSPPSVLPSDWPPFALFSVVTLKMNLPKSSSRLTEDWVIVMVWPGLRSVSSPPGDNEIYFPPSRLSLVIVAAVSLGNSRPSRTVRVTTALKVFGIDMRVGHRSDLDPRDPDIASDIQAVDVVKARLKLVSTSRGAPRVRDGKGQKGPRYDKHSRAGQDLRNAMARHCVASSASRLRNRRLRERGFRPRSHDRAAGSCPRSR